MDWKGLICSFVALMVGLFSYIGITNTNWGKKYSDYQYAIMLACVIIACIVGGVLKAIF